MGALGTLLSTLFESKTISPTFKIPHVLYTLFILGTGKGVGRYRIKNEIGLGEGATKTLLIHLKDAGIINSDYIHQKGHHLTEKGKKIYEDLISRISFPQEVENPGNKFVVGQIAVFSIIKKKAVKSQIVLDITHRDEAIKIGGTGATVVQFDGVNFIFPDKNPLQLPVLLKGIEAGDLLCIGGGQSVTIATLATLAASINLIDL
jgi:predicted transcriptional regulator